MEPPSTPEPDRAERAIDPRRLVEYLRRRGYPDAQLTALSPLGAPSAGALKRYGYGRPLRVSFSSGGVARALVLRTARPDPFGHDRRADRLADLTLAYDSFARVPGHVRALDVGVFDAAGALVSIPRGEPFLVTEWAEGTLYAEDLRRLGGARRPGPLDLARAERLGGYLADLHGERAPEAAYARALRDLLGSGEGVFGLADSYPAEGVVTAARLEALEHAALRWRWRLKPRVHRARRIHGDFHPFNLLFGEGTELTVLDASRGVSGDPADDVTCLSINFLFFALTSGDADFSGAHRALWDTFWRRYLTAARDAELVEVVPPYFAWRTLVLASPVWYPGVAEPLRERLLRFAERLLAGARFDPERVEDLLS